ncbi:MAG: hypothetical protein J0653_04020, partial [Deltaproteobacteria bacterium]|nr:hypothetical protein [Deltaproteobacteria bacterium]
VARIDLSAAKRCSPQIYRAEIFVRVLDTLSPLGRDCGPLPERADVNNLLSARRQTLLHTSRPNHLTSLRSR